MDQPLATSIPLAAIGSPNAGRPATGLPQSPETSARPPEPLSIQDHLSLAQLRRGNWAALEQLVERYKDRLYATVFRIVGHPEDAADLVQETFVKALQNVARFEGKSSLYTWLFRIAVNLAISHRRSNQYRLALSLDGDSTRDGDTAVNQQAAALRRQLAQQTEQDPVEQTDLHLQYERVIAALQKLDPEFRAVIVLRDVEDCDYEQIAQIMDVPIGTIKSRLFRARSALRNAFAEASRDVSPEPNRKLA